MNHKLIISCLALVLLCSTGYAAITQRGNNLVVDGDLTVLGNFTRYNPHQTYYDLTTQVMASTGTPYEINFSNNSGSCCMGLENGKNITFTAGGHYTFAVSGIFSTAAPNKCIELWFRKNGVDIENSNTKMCLAGSSMEVPLAVTLTVDVVPSDKISLMMATDNANSELVYEAATAYSPAVPSIIVEVWKVSSLR